MTRSEIVAYNAGVADLSAIAQASADALRARITEAPTRFNFAIGALDGVVEAAGDLLLPLPPDGNAEGVVQTTPSPRPLLPAAEAPHICREEVPRG